VLNAVIHLQGTDLLTTEEEGEAHTAVEEGPGPIIPELKELYWGAGSFVLFALLMRFFLFPRLKKGMEARYQGIRSDHESADAERASARTEVADYEAQLAGVKAEAATRLEAVRQQLETERQAKIAELNVRLGAQRAEAQAENDAAREAARSHIHAAVADVAGLAGQLATGRRPDAAVVDRVVNEVMAR
jgi:F-type H+-transporting ATPase subunit b